MFDSVLTDCFFLLTGRGNQVASKKLKWWWKIEQYFMETVHVGWLQTFMKSCPNDKLEKNIHAVCIFMVDWEWQ